MIYFAQDSGTFEIKIGYTGSAAEARVKALQTGNPRPIKILAVIEGSEDEEKALHRRFAQHRGGGEWFRPAPELLAFLLAIPQPAPQPVTPRRPWPLKVYLAGKIAKSDWRQDIVQINAELNLWDGEEDSDPPPWPVFSDCIEGGHSYVGPYYFASTDWHSRSANWTPGTHLNEAGIPGGVFHLPGHGEFVETGGMDDKRRFLVHRRCREAVREADLVFAWIDSPDCYGTVVELGMADAFGKLICVAGPQRYPDMWFAYACAAWSRFNFAERGERGHCEAFRAVLHFASQMRDYEAECAKVFS